MSENGPAWGADQWDRIRQIVHDEALRARVAASFLPLYGPMPGATEIVPANSLSTQGDRLAIDDHTALRLVRVSVNVHLKNHMAADPELAAATTLFRRAAQVVARVEDAIIFNGANALEPKNVKGVSVGDGRDRHSIPQVFEVGGVSSDVPGLLFEARKRRNHKLEDIAPADQHLGVRVFRAVVDAVTTLEETGHLQPFACVLSNELFNAVNNPIPGSMVLPRDSIPPYLDGGPLLRSSCIEGRHGLLISLLGDPVEIVVPNDISVRFLQTTLDGDHVFRVSQRFRLRVKDPEAIAAFSVA